MNNKNKGKYALVPIHELHEIFVAAHRYWALESGGVDNWQWEYESYKDYLEGYILLNEKDILENGYTKETLEYFNFDDIAKIDVESYDIATFNKEEAKEE